MKKKLCFLLGTYDDCRLLVEVVKLLPKQYESIFLVYSLKAYNFVKELGLKVEYFSPKTKSFDDKSYVDFEKKYGIPNLRLIYNSDISLRNSEEKEAVQKVVNYILFFEEFFVHEKVDYLFYGTSGSLTERTAYVVAKRYKIPHFSSESGPMHRKETVVLCDVNENWIWSEMLKYYSALQKRELDTKEEVKLNSILLNFYDEGKMFKMCIEPSFKLIAKYAKGFLLYFFSQKDSNVSLLNRVKDELSRCIRISFIRLNKNFFSTFEPNKKYIFFPIHFIEDSQITVRAPFFYNQFELVRQIALSLPVGTLLYTKTHPDDLGGINIKKLKELKKITGVKLLDPLEDSHKIIKNSLAVVSINSTAGWEAMLYKKPLIVIGDVFYKYQKDVIQVGDIRDMPFKIMEAIERKENFYDEKDWKKFIL
ncbi:MAG: hypothetical protein AABX39_01840, partial [Nanoarchaeota archaeon]